MSYRILLVPTLLLSASLSAAAIQAADDWSVPTPGFVQPAPGEHPRLLFRKSDLPALKKRAETPEGKAIIARLKATLGGGEAMPTSYRTETVGSDEDSSKLPFGTFTLGHAAGFGFLYQLTGDKKYAELSQQCAQKMMDGVRDPDNRFGYRKPYSTIRGGPGLMCMALAYDLSYDGWPEDFRKKVALDMQNYREVGDKASSNKEYSLRNASLYKGMPPTSNHFGPAVGGAGMAVLALRGDPNTDDKLLASYFEGVCKSITVQFESGQGSAGYYFESPGPGQITTDGSFTAMLQAMRIAGGRDYVTPRPHAQWIALRWAMWLRLRDGKPWYPLSPGPSGYGTEWFERGVGYSRAGQFGQGFGMLDDRNKAALLWTYQNVVEPSEKEVYNKFLPNGEKSYDVMQYPHRAIMAFVNWPIGIAPVNPGEVLPRVTVDDFNQQVFFRAQWKDDQDILGQFIFKARDSKKERARVAGLGEVFSYAPVPQGALSYQRLATDGSFSVTCGNFALAVDLSKKSGADAVLVMSGGNAGAPEGIKDKAKVAYSSVTAGNATFHITTLQTGTIPKPEVDGNAVKIGGQTISMDAGRITFSHMAAELGAKK